MIDDEGYEVEIFPGPPWWKPNWYPAKTRTRKVLRCLWCFAFDWTDAIGGLYREAASWPRRVVCGWFQVVWFRAHNNRFYCWLDER